MRHFIAVLMLLAAGAAAAADDEAARLEPALYLQFAFGGARGAPADPQLGARLDYRAAGAFADLRQPALLRWHLDAQRSVVTAAGLPLLQSAGYRVASHDGHGDGDGENGGDKAAKIVGISIGGTVVLVSVAAWLFSEMMEDTGEAFGEGMSGGFGDGSVCNGVEVGDDCIGNGAEGGGG